MIVFGRKHWFQERSAGVVASVWLLCFCACFLIALLMRVNGSIETDTLLATVGSVTDFYSANLAVILGFYCHRRLASKKRGFRSLASIYIALFATLVWNGVILGAYGAAFAGVVAIDEATKFIGVLLPKLAWLVAPMLGFYFAAPENASDKQDSARSSEASNA